MWGTLKRDPVYDLAKEEILNVHYTLSLEYGILNVKVLSVDDCVLKTSSIVVVDETNPAKWYCPSTC